MKPQLLIGIQQIFGNGGVDLAAVGFAWARVVPTLTLVPAFGLRSMPFALRAAMGFLIALCIAPAMVLVPIPKGIPWPLILLAQAAQGVPIAIAAAVPLWSATMVGETIDALRGAREGSGFSIVDGSSSPLSVLFALLGCMAFLASGGPTRVALALVGAPNAGVQGPWLRAAWDVSSGITIAIAIAAPLLAASVVIEVAMALLARAAAPTQIQTFLNPLRSIGLLLLVGFLSDRIVGALERCSAR